MAVDINKTKNVNKLEGVCSSDSKSSVTICVSQKIEDHILTHLSKRYPHLRNPVSGSSRLTRLSI